MTTTVYPSRFQTRQLDQTDAVTLAVRLVDVAALAGIGLVSLFLFWTRVRLDPNFFNGDIVTQFMPLYTVVAERLRAGDLPGWNPSYFSGMPLAGDPISGWGYLPVMGFFLLFGPLGAYQLSVLFHLTLAGVATYLLARKLGMGPLGGLVAAIAYEAGPLWYFAKIATARMQLAPWIPLGLLTVEMAVRSRRWSSRLLWWGLSGAVISQMIAGYFGKGMYYGILTIGAYVLYRTLIDPPVPTPIRARLIAFAMHAPAVLAAGMALAAIVLLPRLDFMGRANLAGGSYEVVAPGVATAEGWTINQALANILNPNQLKYYIGGATFALAVAGVILARRRFSVPFFALFSAGVLILTLAPTPLHTVLYLLLPKFKVIHEHVPSRILVVFNIGPAMLAGTAVASIERHLVRPVMIGIAGFGVVAVCGGVAELTSRGGRELNGEVWTATLVVAALLGIAAVSCWAAPRLMRHGDHIARFVPAAGLLLVLFWFSAGPAIDQIPDHPRLLPSLDNVPLAYADQEDAQGAGAFLKSVEGGSPFRYFGYDKTYLKDEGNRVNYHAFEDDPRTEAILTNNRAIMLHLQDIQGYNPVHSMRYVKYIDALNGAGQEYHETDILPSGFGSPLLALLNAEYVILPANPEPGFQAPANLGKEVFRTDQVRVVELPNALPRAWIVHDARQMATDTILPTLASGAVDPRSTVLLETPPPSLEQTSSADQEQVSILSYEPDRIRVKATANAAGMVVLSEMYDPGWQAFIDGKRVPIYQADYILRAIPVDAGTHTIELRYAPLSLTIGTVITVATLVALIAAIAGLWWYERRSGRSVPLFTIRSRTHPCGDRPRP